ncbi:MAG: chemotaxis response regulator protein-glutamate methylesterase [Mycobacteriales bacterium]
MSTQPVRVLVVDDSVVVRLLLAEAIRADPELELVGVAPNGRAGLEKVEALNPDVVVLDVEMPELDGLQTLAELRRRGRKLPVVMFSTLTSRGASATVEALTLGASDYVTKPSTSSREESLAVLRDELAPKLRALGRQARDRPATRWQAPMPRVAATERAAPVELVVLGISTGGPNALAEMLPQLPPDLPAPVLVVQHMPAMFTAMLAGRLDARCPLRVAEAAGGETPRPGELWIAPGGRHLAVTHTHGEPRLVVHDGPHVNSCRPAVDVLFESAAEAYGEGVLAVVMTGMGQDGLRGCQAVRAAGGQVVAQDEASSVVWGMPRFVAETGLAHAVVPLDAMAQEISRRVPSPVPAD